MSRETVLQLPLSTRWFLFLAAWSSLTLGGMALLGAWLLTPLRPVQAAAPAAPPLALVRSTSVR